MVDFNELLKENGVTTPLNSCNSRHFDIEAIEKHFEDEDYEIAGRRKALFNKSKELTNQMNRLSSIIQNPISKDQKMDEFVVEYSNLQSEIEDWSNRVELLVKDSISINN